jgi:hypothetical protein
MALGKAGEKSMYLYTGGQDAVPLTLSSETGFSGFYSALQRTAP